MKKSLIMLLLFFLVMPYKLFSARTVEIPFEGYTLGMDMLKAIKASPSHKTIEKDTLGVSGIYYFKDKLKYSIWFYKQKVHGITVEGKIKENIRIKAVKSISQLLGLPSRVREFISTNYYWYFTKERVLYTIEIKAYIIDIHYSISDNGIGIN
jgi:hypothetical protein